MSDEGWFIYLSVDFETRTWSTRWLICIRYRSVRPVVYKSADTTNMQPTSTYGLRAISQAANSSIFQHLKTP